MDELSQVNPAVAVEVAYLLGNGFGKSRLNRDLITRQAFLWRLLYLSAGETTLAAHAATAGRRTRGGAEIRLINLYADAGHGFGLFENLHAFPSADDFARALERNALQYYGTPFREFVGTLVAKRKWTRKILLSFQEKFRRHYLPTNASGEVRRAADRFALVAVAGELATRWGITGWGRREALLAAGRCFREWVRSMGRVDPRIWRRQSDAYATSSKAASLALPWLVVIHGARATSVIVQTLSGPTDGEGKEFLILPQVFWEACDGVSQQAVARELERRGHLRRTAPHFTLKERLPGFANPIRVFCVRASIFGEHDDV